MLENINKMHFQLRIYVPTTAQIYVELHYVVYNCTLKGLRCTFSNLFGADMLYLLNGASPKMAAA